MDKTPNQPNVESPNEPEPIFEDVVDQKFPGAYESMMAPEEISDESTSVDDVAYNPTPTGFAPKQSDDKLQRYIFIGAIVVFFFGIFFVLYSLFKPSGSTKVAASNTPVTLTYWGLWEDEEFFAQAIESYKKTRPNVTINYKKMSPVDYLALLKSRSKNGKGPDIFRFHNTWLPNLVGSESYLAAAPNEIFTPTEFKSTFYDVATSDLVVGGKIYAIPLYVDALVLLYNKQIMQNVGVTLLPQNLELIGSFVELVGKPVVVNESGTLETAGVAMGTYANISNAPDILASLVLLNSLTNQKDLSSTWARGTFKSITTGSNQKVIEDALKIYTSAIDQKLWSQDMPNSIDAFTQGKVAFVYSYMWQIPYIKSKNPSLDFAAIPLPVGLPDSTTGKPKRLSIASYWVEGVSSYSRNQVEAFKFLRHLSEAKSLQARFEKQVSTLGVGFPSSRRDMKSAQSTNKYANAVLTQTDHLVSVPLTASTYDQSINDESVKYIENAINTPLNGGSYSSAIDTLRSGLQSIYTKYNIDY